MSYLAELSKERVAEYDQLIKEAYLEIKKLDEDIERICPSNKWEKIIDDRISRLIDANNLIKVKTSFLKKLKK
jgi:hypothetical protein